MEYLNPDTAAFLVPAIEELADLLDMEEYSSEGSRFHALRLPKISLSEYIDRMIRYCPASEATYTVMYIYLDRIANSSDEAFINKHTLHRLVLAAFVVASKYCDDVFETNSYYARVGGISVAEINNLEIEFLSRLHFDLFVPLNEYGVAEDCIYRPLAAKSAEERAKAHAPTTVRYHLMQQCMTQTVVQCQ